MFVFFYIRVRVIRPTLKLSIVQVLHAETHFKFNHNTIFWEWRKCTNVFRSKWLSTYKTYSMVPEGQTEIVSQKTDMTMANLPVCCKCRCKGLLRDSVLLKAIRSRKGKYQFEQLGIWGAINKVKYPLQYLGAKIYTDIFYNIRKITDFSELRS